MTRDSRLLPLPAGDAVLQFRDRLVNRGAQRVIERLGFVSIGSSRAMEVRFYAVTAERRLTHPAIIAITERAISKGKKKPATK